MDCERGPPLKIHKGNIDECFDKANFRPNFAVQLVKRVYSKNERGTSNSSGDHRHRKRKLSPNRMLAVKNAVYTYHPVLPSETVWKAFRIATDSSCRQLNRPKKTHLHIF